MFDLETKIEEWRAELRAAGLAPEVVRELEEHLREDIQRRLRGVSEREAFEAAVRQIGQPGELKKEFDRAGPPGVLAFFWQHKWKLVLCSTLGLIAAIALVSVRTGPYVSQAKLYVRFLPAVGPEAEESLQTKALEFESEIAPGARVTRRRPGPESNVLEFESEIVGSHSLAREVVAKIGAARILEKAGGGSDRDRAVALLKNGLRVETVRASAVLTLGFRHPDPLIARAVLNEVISQYAILHKQAHVSPRETSPAMRQVSNLVVLQRPSPPTPMSISASIRVAVFCACVMAGFAWVWILRLSEIRMRLAP
jgi:hypothetical protein